MQLWQGVPLAHQLQERSCLGALLGYGHTRASQATVAEAVAARRRVRKRSSCIASGPKPLLSQRGRHREASTAPKMPHAGGISGGEAETRAYKNKNYSRVQRCRRRTPTTKTHTMSMPLQSVLGRRIYKPPPVGISAVSLFIERGHNTAANKKNAQNKLDVCTNACRTGELRVRLVGQAT